MTHKIEVSTNMLEFIKKCVRESNRFYIKCNNSYSTPAMRKTIDDHKRVIESIDVILKPKTLSEDLDFILEAIKE